MNVLHEIIALVLPYMISVLELIGIIVVFWSGIYGFWQYLQNTFMKKDFDISANLAKGLAMGLEFKMAAEILRTVLIKTKEEFILLGAVILLRALLSLLIHYEIKHPKKKGKKTAEEKNED